MPDVGELVAQIEFLRNRINTLEQIVSDLSSGSVDNGYRYAFPMGDARSASSGDVPEGFSWQELDIVSDSDYSIEDGRFVNTIKKIRVLAKSDSSEDEVFTTVPHTTSMDS